MKSPTFVRFSSAPVVAQFRTEVHSGVEYVVAPFVALVGDIVVEGLNSEAPEFVPASVLAAAPAGFNGRPLVNIHPLDGKGSANTPQSWDEQVYGQVFNSEFSDNRLKVECWFNPEQAERAGEGAMEVLAKVRTGELVEVSVGAWVWLEEDPGVAPDGTPYEQRWQAMVPDHLAVGLQAQGGKGACSVETGCGGPRLLTAKQATQIVNIRNERKETSKMKSLASVIEKLGAEGLQALAEGMSDNALRQKLNKALRAVVPGFWGVEEVFPDSSTAIFVARPEDEIQFWECAFTVEGDSVTIGRRKQVEPVTRWEKVAAAANDKIVETDKAEINSEAADDKAPSAKPPCQCHQNAQNGQGDRDMSKIAELAGKLIAAAAAHATKSNGTSAPVFTDADKPKLEAMSEPQLEALVAVYTAEPAKQEPAPEPKAEVKTEAKDEGDPDVVTLSRTEANRLRQMANREEKREKAHRETIIASLVAAGCAYTEKQLQAKDTEDLDLLARSLDINEEPSFEGRGLHAVERANGDKDKAVVPTDPWKTGALGKQLGYATPA